MDEVRADFPVVVYCRIIPGYMQHTSRADQISWPSNDPLQTHAGTEAYQSYSSDLLFPNLPRAVLIGFVLSNLAIFLIAASITRRLLDVEYDLLIFPHLLTSFISVASAIIPLMVINHSSISDITMIILSAILFCATFIAICHYTKNRGYLLVTNALRNKLKHFHFTHIES